MLQQWADRVAAAIQRRSRPATRSAPDDVLRRRRERRTAYATGGGRLPTWTVTTQGSGFAATDDAGHRAVGLARSAAAIEEILSGLTVDNAPVRLQWRNRLEPVPPGQRLNVWDTPPLGEMASFVAASDTERDRLRQSMPAVVSGWPLAGLTEQIHQRAAELDQTHPVVDLDIGQLSPDGRTDQHEDLGRARTFGWIEVDKVVGGGVHRWNDFRTHRPDTVPWIVQHVLTAQDPATAALQAQADDIHRFADFVAASGPAGPIYLVGNGRHRTHAMRILRVPWMVGEITSYPLPVLVDQDEFLADGDHRIKADRVWQGLIDRGLLDADIVCAGDAFALQPYWVAAPWLLLSPVRAAIISERYQRIYPDALGIPSDAFTSVEAWIDWCTGT